MSLYLLQDFSMCTIGHRKRKVTIPFEVCQLLYLTTYREHGSTAYFLNPMKYVQLEKD